jgi:hypothetical protein
MISSPISPAGAGCSFTYNATTILNNGEQKRKAIAKKPNRHSRERFSSEIKWSLIVQAPPWPISDLSEQGTHL